MPNRKGSKVVDIHLRLYRRRPTDDRLIKWLAQFDDRPRGAKSEAIKGAMRRGIGERRDQDTTADKTEGKGTEEATAGIQDLSAIRQVVEAAVAAALARCGGQTTLFPGPSQAEDDEVQGTLDRLCGELLISAGDPEVPDGDPEVPAGDP